MNLLPERTRFGVLKHMIRSPSHVVVMVVAMVAVMAVVMMMMMR
jgi:hypothetical protein